MKETKTSHNLDIMPHFLIRELDILKQLSGHPNIIEMKASYSKSYDSNKKLLSICFEYANGGDLESVLYKNKKEHNKGKCELGLPLDKVLDYAE